MSIVNLTTVANISNAAIQPQNRTLGISRNKSIQAHKSFFNGKELGFKVTAIKRAYPGKKGNILRVGVFLQAGVRYMITLFEADTDKLDGTVSTASEGGNKLKSDGIVAKINSSALGAFIKAELVNSQTSVNYTGASNVVFADSLPLKGGRSRGR